MAADATGLCTVCSKQLRCQRDNLACNALVMFRRGHSLDRCRLVPRQPTAEYAAQLKSPTAALKPKVRAPMKWKDQVNMRELRGDDEYDGEERRNACQ